MTEPRPGEHDVSPDHGKAYRPTACRERRSAMRRTQWVPFALLASLLLGGASPAAAQEAVIKMTAEKFKFTPAVIQLKVGVPVVLELVSLDRKHGFQVPDLNIDETIEPGKVTRVRIVPATAATYDFHCDLFCGSGHEEMTGQIVVSP